MNAELMMLQTYTYLIFGVAVVSASIELIIIGREQLKLNRYVEFSLHCVKSYILPILLCLIVMSYVIKSQSYVLIAGLTVVVTLIKISLYIMRRIVMQKRVYISVIMPSALILIITIIITNILDSNIQMLKLGILLVITYEIIRTMINLYKLQIRICKRSD